MTAPRRRRWLIAAAIIAAAILALVALPVSWALTARPVGGPDAATALHEIAAEGRDPAEMAAGAAAWDAMRSILADLEVIRQEAQAANVPTGVSVRVGPPPLLAAAASAGLPLEERAAIWPLEPSAEDVRVGLAVADATLARVTASDLLQRAAALPTPLPSPAQLEAFGFGSAGQTSPPTGSTTAPRRLADAAAAAGLLALDAGRIGDAFTALDAMVRAAETVDAVPTLFSALTGARIREWIVQFTGAMVDRGALDAADLIRLDDTLRRLGPSEVRRSVRGERAFVESILLDAYDPQGRLLIAELLPRLDPAMSPPTGLARLKNLGGLFAPRRPDLERSLDELFAWPADEAASTTREEPSSTRQAMEMIRGNVPAVIMPLLTPAVDAARTHARDALARHRAARLAIAVARQHIETGIVPWSLSAVRLPDDDPVLRIDPRTGAPFALYPRSPGAHPAAGPLVVRSTGAGELVEAPSPPRWRARSRSQDGD